MKFNKKTTKTFEGKDLEELLTMIIEGGVRMGQSNPNKDSSKVTSSYISMIPVAVLSMEVEV